MKISGNVTVRQRGPLPNDGAAEPGGVADMMRRYPDLGEAERLTLLRFVKRASRTEIRDAFLRTGLEGRLIAFRKDHGNALRRGWPALAPYLFATLLLANLLQLLR